MIKNIFCYKITPLIEFIIKKITFIKLTYPTKDPFTYQLTAGKTIKSRYLKSLKREDKGFREWMF